VRARDVRAHAASTGAVPGEEEVEKAAHVAACHYCEGWQHWTKPIALPEARADGFLQDLVRRVAYEDTRALGSQGPPTSLLRSDRSGTGRRLGVRKWWRPFAERHRGLHPTADEAKAIQAEGGANVRARRRARGRAGCCGEGASVYDTKPPTQHDLFSAQDKKLVDRAGSDMAWIAASGGGRGGARMRHGIRRAGDAVAKAVVEIKLAEIDFNDGRVPRAVARMGAGREAIEALGRRPRSPPTIAHVRGRFSFLRAYERAALCSNAAMTLAVEDSTCPRRSPGHSTSKSSLR